MLVITCQREKQGSRVVKDDPGYLVWYSSWTGDQELQLGTLFSGYLRSVILFCCSWRVAV